MKLHPLFLLILLFLSIPYAQITIDSITTDTVDIFQHPSAVNEKTSTSALWSSLLLPGCGHQMSNRPRSALIYISADIISLFGAIYFHQQSQKYTRNSKALAFLHADVINDASDNEYYWQIIGSFNNYFDYHTAYSIDMRVRSDKFNEENYLWDWGPDTLYRYKYVDMQKLSKKMSTVSSFCIGAMILNRIIAFIDLRSNQKNQRFRQFSSTYFKAVVNSSSEGIVLSTSF